MIMIVHSARAETAGVYIRPALSSESHQTFTKGSVKLFLKDPAFEEWKTKIGQDFCAGKYISISWLEILR